jgi:hypothetical protein
MSSLPVGCVSMLLSRRKPTMYKYRNFTISIKNEISDLQAMAAEELGVPITMSMIIETYKV